MAVGNPRTATEVNTRFADDAAYAYQNIYELARRRAALWLQNMSTTEQIQAVGITDAGDIASIQGAASFWRALVDLFENRVPQQADWATALRNVIFLR